MIRDSWIKVVSNLKVSYAYKTTYPLIKAMSQQQLDQHLDKMGIRYMFNWL